MHTAAIKLTSASSKPFVNVSMAFKTCSRDFVVLKSFVEVPSGFWGLNKEGKKEQIK